jgi:hypothetical protein
LNKDLDQVVNKIALSPDCTKDPYLVLNALQTYHTHKLNKVTKDHGTALVTTTTSRKFPSKVVHYCGFGEHNPAVTSHPQQRFFKKYPHLGKAAKAAKNASASLADASAHVMFTSQERHHTFVIDSAASHHMLSDWNLIS